MKAPKKNVKYLYRFCLGNEVVAEAYGIFKAEQLYNSFAPQLKLGLKVLIYKLIEESEEGGAGGTIGANKARILALNAPTSDDE